MSMSSFTLPEVILLAAAGIAAGSLVLAAIGLVAAWTVRRRSPPTRHGLLLATLVVVALLPVLIPWLQSRGLGWDIRSERPNSPRTFAPLTATIRQSPVSSTTLELPTDGSLQGDGMTVAEVMARYGDSTAPAARTSTPAAPHHEEAIDVRRLTAAGVNILCLAWLAGSCFSLIRALRASRSLGRWMRRAAPICESHIVELLTECASDAGLTCRPALVSSSDATVPYVSGLWRPRIVLPASLAAADEPTLRGILLHELAHIRRRDLWVGLVQRLVGAAFWWNPLVHRLNARLAEVREDLCDNYVLAHISDPRDYAQTLVDLASQAAAARVVPSMGLLNRSPNRLSGRIQRILQEDRPMATRLGGVSKVLLMVFVFALGAGSTLFVIRLPDILPDTDSGSTPVTDSPTVMVDLLPEPTISLVGHAQGSDSTGIEMESTSPMMPTDVSLTEPEAGHDLTRAATNADPSWVWSTTESPQPADGLAFGPPPQIEGGSAPVPAIPADDAPTPFAPPTVEAVPVLADESFTPSSPLGPSSPVLQPAGNDPFSAPPAQILPEPAIADDALPLDTFAEPAPPPKALVLVELAANPDGSIKQLRYLTEDLGTDDAAFQQLEKQIVAWAGQFPGGDLTVQVVADPQLRYEHVARITKLCSPLVTRVVLAEAEIKAQVTITVGFVRDAQGRPVVATPVVFWQDEVVRLGELQSRLESWIHSSAQELQKQLGQIAPSQPGALAAMVRDVTLILRCDSSVEYTVVESIMKEARQAGFEHFAIQGIDAADVAFHPVRGVVTEIDRMAGLLRISIGADDGLKPGDELTVNHEQGADDYSSQENIVSRVRVKDVAGDSAWCFILHHDARDPIRAGDMVQTVRSQTANPADNETTD